MPHIFTAIVADKDTRRPLRHESHETKRIFVVGTPNLLVCAHMFIFSLLEITEKQGAKKKNYLRLNLEKY